MAMRYGSFDVRMPGRTGAVVSDERRAFERFPSDLQARIVYGNLIYTGKIRNLSRNGMFVSTKVAFPVNAEFMMVVLTKNGTVKVPVKVRRRVQTKSVRTENGIGVELLSAPLNYTALVNAISHAGAL